MKVYFKDDKTKQSVLENFVYQYELAKENMETFKRAIEDYTGKPINEVLDE